jgi:hypothetical protein
MISIIMAGARSLAISTGIVAAVAAGVAVLKMLWDRPDPAEQRSRFLKVIGQSPDVPPDLFVIFHEDDDPISMAVALLRDNPPENVAAALRAALAAAA